MRTVPVLVTALVAAFATLGVLSYNVSYIDNSKYWGIPTRDAASLQNAEQEQLAMEQRVAALPALIAKRQEQIAFLVEQQKYLYNKLYNAHVDLEKNSTLDLALIERIGPMANLYLRDLTKTDEANNAIVQYESTLPLDSPVRVAMNNLRLALAQDSKSKSEYLEKLLKWRQVEAEAQMLLYAEKAKQEAIRQEREYQRMMTEPYVAPPPPKPKRVPKAIENQPPVDENGYVDPNYAPMPEPTPEPEPEPYDPYSEFDDANYRTSTAINGKDSELLGKAHWIMADIQMTQVKMVQLTKEIVRDYETIDKYNAMLQGGRPNTMQMFVRDRSWNVLEVDQPLYECRIGIYWCREVGKIKGVTGEKTQAPSPTSGKMQPGFLIPIELTDPKAGNKLLHIYDPPTH